MARKLQTEGPDLARALREVAMALPKRPHPKGRVAALAAKDSARAHNPAKDMRGALDHQADGREPPMQAG